MTFKYKSINKPVAKALNSSWIVIGIPFFSSMIGVTVLGFYLLIKYEIGGDLTPALIILLAIVVPVFICHLISKVWFSILLDKVSDKREFAERAKRNQMIWPSTADRIMQKKGLSLTDRVSLVEKKLPDLKLTDKLILTNDKIIVNEQQYLFVNLKDFRLTTTKSGGLRESVLMLIFKDNRFERQQVEIVDKQEIEFQLDKYLNNKNIKSTMS